MLPNVVGMSQYADGGRMTTKPYTSAGAYVNRMSDLCGPCGYRPGDRTCEHACPYTTGYWAFLDRHRELLAGNQRVARPVRQSDRLADLPDVCAQGTRGVTHRHEPRRCADGVKSDRTPCRNGQKSVHPQQGTRRKQWRADNRE